MFSLPGHVLFWIVALLIFLAVEAVSAGLVSIWFAGGALAACIVALLKVKIWTQIAVFLIVSIVLILLTRPLQKKLAEKLQKTNVDALIGRTGTVAEEIPAGETGRVHLEGKLWTARNENCEPIPVGSKVTVIAIEGVTLTVKTGC